jgi:redox-sensitive bicupin YhaK (pirin superfamily)
MLRCTEAHNSMAEQLMGPRTLSRVVRGHATTDGAGVRLTRVIGTNELEHLDPFLQLDELRSETKGDDSIGFPSHPHRGCETVTYMLVGSIEHRDRSGRCGRLESGGVQWLTAGRGVVHSEMPRPEHGLVWGFQLWVNLSASNKMCEPRYQDISRSDVPELELPNANGRVRLIAGTFHGVNGPVTGIATDPLYLDIAVAPYTQLEVAIPNDHNACLYVFAGSARVGDSDSAKRTLSRHDLGILGPGTSVRVHAQAHGARFLALAARPLHEPVMRYGPFVMNTREELQKAVYDFRSAPELSTDRDGR